MQTNFTVQVVFGALHPHKTFQYVGGGTTVKSKALTLGMNFTPEVGESK